MADKQFFFTDRAWGQSNPEGAGVQVARMTHPDLLLEIEAMAVV